MNSHSGDTFKSFIIKPLLQLKILPPFMFKPTFLKDERLCKFVQVATWHTNNLGGELQTF